MKKYYHFLGIIILALILAKIDFQKLIIYFSRLNFKIFVLINLLIFPALLIKAYRWKYLLHLQGIEYPFSDAFVSYLRGICAGIVTPARMGEAIRAVHLQEEKGIPLSAGLASVFLDRLFDLYILSILGYLGLWHFLYIKNFKFGLLSVVFILFIFAPFILLLNKPLLTVIVKKIYNSIFSGIDKNLFEGQIKDFFSASKKIIMQHIYLPAVITILSYLIYFWQSYLLARLASINISYLTVVFFVSITSLVSMLPITILGFGTREASLVYLFSLVGLNAESAIVYSFLLFFSFNVVVGILAYASWFIKGISKNTICNDNDV